jgi:hypothetical protein
VSAERGSGLVFLSYDAGNVVGVPVKFDHPRPDPDKPGKVMKHEPRKGCPPPPYTSPAARGAGRPDR